jgi:transmembrane sensor
MSMYMGKKDGAYGREEVEQRAEAWFNSYDTSRSVKVYANPDEKERIRREIFKDVISKIDGVRSRRVTFLRVAAMLLLFSGMSLFVFKYWSVVQPQSVHLAWNMYKATGRLPRSIKLPDSSTVILKPGASLSIPSNFNRTIRIAKLINGEAFFDVKRNLKKPFIVQFGQLSVKVLGTAFTVEDDKLSNRKIVAVAHGLVQVSDGSRILSLLTKGKRLQYRNGTRQFFIDHVAASLVGCWSKNTIELNDAPFNQLAETFKALYGKGLNTHEGGIRTSHFTLTLYKKQQASAILKIIGRTHGLKFYEEDGKITLTKRK